jgi:hypothetical protein
VLDIALTRLDQQMSFPKSFPLHEPAQSTFISTISPSTSKVNEHIDFPGSFGILLFEALLVLLFMRG